MTPTAHEQVVADRRFFDELVRLLARLALSLLAPALLLAVVLFACWIYGVPRNVSVTLALVLAGAAVLRLMGALSRALFGLPREERLVRVKDRSARHFHRSLTALGATFGVFTPLAAVLEVNAYPAGAIEAVHIAGRFLTVAVLVFLFGRRSRFLAILPAAETRVGRFLVRAAVLLYPLVAVYLTGLLAIDGLGYGHLARYLGRSTALSAFVVAGAYLVWKWISLRIAIALEAAASATPSEGDDAVDLAHRRHLLAAASVLARVLLASAAALAVPFAWGIEWWQVEYTLSDQPIPFLSSDADGLTPLDVFLALVFALLTFFGSRSSRYLARRGLRRSRSFDRGTQEAMATGVMVAVVGVGTTLALSRLRLNLDALKWLGGAVGLGIGFGMQNIVNNFVSGLILLLERPIRSDDIVEVQGGVAGRVERIGARSTMVVDFDNIVRVIPNSVLIQGEVTNWTRNDPVRRIQVEAIVPHGADLDRVRCALVECALAQKLVMPKPAPYVYLDALGEEEFKVSLCCYIQQAALEREVRSDLRFAIDAAFRRAGFWVGPKGPEQKP